MAQKQLIIGLTGPMRAGKSTMCRHLASTRGAWTYTVSDMLGKMLDLLGQERTRDNYARLARTLIDEYGYGTVTRRIVQKIDAQIGNKTGWPQIFIVDGIRFPEMRNILLGRRNVRFLAINAPLEVRFGRAKNAEDNKLREPNLTLDEFMAQHYSPNECRIPELVATADATIENEDSLEELYAAVDMVINRWLSEL